ncbi:hypothetical protein MTO96_023937 [Rhipicephalus appendiculatus]
METFAYATYLQHLIVTLAIVLIFRVIWIFVRIRHAAEACKIPRKKPAKLMIVPGIRNRTFYDRYLLHFALDDGRIARFNEPANSLRCATSCQQLHFARIPLRWQRDRCPVGVVCSTSVLRGHTFEMLKLVENISTTSYSPRVYVTATTDPMSADKAKQLEMWRVASSSQVLLLRFLSSKKDATDGPEAEEPSDYVVERIPRSRELHQSWLTTVPTTLYALLASAPILLRHSPDVIICNGPGTCVPIVLMSFVLAVLGTKRTTGGWPQLTTKYPRATYHGLLV